MALRRSNPAACRAISIQYQAAAGRQVSTTDSAFSNLLLSNVPMAYQVRTATSRSFALRRRVSTGRRISRAHEAHVANQRTRKRLLGLTCDFGSINCRRHFGSITCRKRQVMLPVQSHTVTHLCPRTIKFVTVRFDEGAKIRRLCSKILCKGKIKFVTHAVFEALSTGFSGQLSSSLLAHLNLI